MPLSEKINLQRYALLTIILNVGLGFFIPLELQYIVSLIVLAVAIAMNHLMLGTAVMMLTSVADGQKKGKKLAFLFIGKFAILAGALLIGIHFMEGLVLIPLISYILQLGILIASLKGETG